jgi:hypothetical protein
VSRCQWLVGLRCWWKAWASRRFRSCSRALSLLKCVFSLECWWEQFRCIQRSGFLLSGRRPETSSVQPVASLFQKLFMPTLSPTVWNLRITFYGERSVRIIWNVPRAWPSSPSWKDVQLNSGGETIISASIAKESKVNCSPPCAGFACQGPYGDGNPELPSPQPRFIASWQAMLVP